MSLRILFVLGWPLDVGGHISSTHSLLQGVKERGAVTYLIAFNGARIEQFHKVTDRLFLLIYRESVFIRKVCLFKKILQTSHQYDIDIIQAQDYVSLYPAYMAASILRKPLFFTKAGGEIPTYYIPKEVRVIVFSSELEEGMKCAGYPNYISVIQARINCETFHPNFQNSRFVEKYGLPLDSIRVVLAMRFDSEKKMWLEGLFESLERLRDENVVLVIAGDGPLLPWIFDYATKINRKLNRTAVYLIGTITEPENMKSLYSYADIVIGHGRGIMEAMACGKAVINIGENGFCTVVDPESVEHISYYNFSGRHLRHYPALGRPLLAEILRLSSTPGLINCLGEFSLRYIRQFYDADLGAEALLNLYNKDELSRSGMNLHGLTRFVAHRTRLAITNRFTKQ